jgi:hypothetical protein
MGDDSRGEYIYKFVSTKTWAATDANPNGHVLRVKEGSAGNAATTFSWDVYVFGAESSAAPGTVNLSSLTDDQDFSSPDGLVFSPATGIMWIQTDDGAYTDVTNCMMLAALPGTVGDGAKKTLSYTKADTTTLNVDTYVGKAPGETTAMTDIADPTKYTSQWPSNAGYGAGKRPRSATIVITKNDGGKIGT